MGVDGCGGLVAGRRVGSRQPPAGLASSMNLPTPNLPTPFSSFGHTHSRGKEAHTCRTLVDGKAVETDSFACVCAFEAAPEKPTTSGAGAAAAAAPAAKAAPTNATKEAPAAKAANATKAAPA